MLHTELLSLLATRTSAVSSSHPVRVGIDGVDAAGKTLLADALAGWIHDRPVIRASIDRFHQPRTIRYRLGANSPQGYYADSYDLPALRAKLLDPLGAGGDRWIVTGQFDYRADAPMDALPFLAPEDAVLLFDGIFLHRPELAGCWDLSIFLSVSFETVLARAKIRHRDEPDVLARYPQRYIPAQQEYLERCRPEERATIVIDNNEPANPIVLRM